MIDGGLFRILIADDNVGDARLATEVLYSSQYDYDVFHVDDGVETMKFLRREGVHQDAPRPNVLLLDLNMPRMDGRDVLTALKSDADLRSIPVIVFTVSNRREDVDECYALGANCYLNKPVDFDELETILHSLEQFWFGAVTLPTMSR